MKKVKLGMLIEGKEALQKLIKVQLPIKKTYALHKLVRSLNEEYETYQKLQQAILDKCGTPKEDDPRQYSIHDKEMYIKEIMELHNIEKEFDIDFSINDIPEDATFSAAEIEMLAWLLD